MFYQILFSVLAFVLLQYYAHFLSLVILSSRDLKTLIPHEQKQGIQILVLISIAQVPSLNP